MNNYNYDVTVQTRKLTRIGFAIFGLVLMVFVVYRIVQFRNMVSPSLLFDVRYFFKLQTTRKSIAIQGIDGWLFYRPALNGLRVPWPEKTSQNIIALNDLLRKKDIQLVVVPVPNKSDVYPELLGLGSPRTISNQRNRFFNTLNSSGVHNIDLLPAFNKIKGVDTMYLKHDTHWNQRGILIASDTISRRIRELVPGLSDTLLLCCKDTVGHRYDDLYRILHHDSTCVEDGLYYWSKVTNNDGSSFIHDPASLVLIFGDSFINAGSDVGAQLSAHISQNLNYKTRNLFQLNASIKGPSMLMRFLQETEYQPKVVVWVFVSCQLENEFNSPFPG